MSTWEQIYCSLVLILVAFFAMLVSYSTVEGGRVTNFLRGFGTSSQVYSTSVSEDYIGKAGVYTGGLKSAGDKAIMRPSPDIIGTGGGGSVSLTMAEINAMVNRTGLPESVGVERTGGGFKVIFGSGVLFPPGIAELSKSATPYLDGIAAVAMEEHYSLRIEGHTDNVSISTPSFPSNWELSTTRAVNVLRYFLDNKKMSARNLAAVGFSEYHPIVSNETPEGREKNRRVEIYFDRPQEKKVPFSERGR